MPGALRRRMNLSEVSVIMTKWNSWPIDDDDLLRATFSIRYWSADEFRPLAEDLACVAFRECN